MLDWSDFATETAVIEAETINADGSTTAENVYSGAVDFQPQTGDKTTDPAGQLQMVDALVFIDPATDGTLPAITLVDGGPTYTVVVDGLRYDIIFAPLRAAPPRHLELHLKRGPQRFKEPRR